MERFSSRAVRGTEGRLSMLMALFCASFYVLKELIVLFLLLLCVRVSACMQEGKGGWGGGGGGGGGLCMRAYESVRVCVWGGGRFVGGCACSTRLCIRVCHITEWPEGRVSSLQQVYSGSSSFVFVLHYDMDV